MMIRVLLLAFFIPIISWGQTLSEVQSTGHGMDRPSALSDALRQAISQACGTYVQATTKVENYMTLEDAIVTNTNGYIQSYQITSEKKNGNDYEVSVTAKVSIDPLKKDAALLAQFTGNIRFMVLYDERFVKEEEKSNYRFAYNRINEKLLESKLRYIESDKFSQSSKEVYAALGKDTSQSTFTQKLGMISDAEFLMLIRNVQVRVEQKSAGLYSAKATIEASAYDNCTADGLASTAAEGEWKTLPDKEQAVKKAIQSAVEKCYPQLMQAFTQRLGSWVNGAPFQIRFYGVKTPRYIIQLIELLHQDADFGGEMQHMLTPNYIRLDFTYKGRPTALYNKLMQYIDQLPELKKLQLDVKIFYGRQLSLAPPKYVIPENSQPITPTK